MNGQKTKSGASILCNDPHLNLNMPSLWYEVQLTCPDYSVYGASLPGTPGVIIGFNEDIAWGITAMNRDVKDWYQIHWKDRTNYEYWLDGKVVKAELDPQVYKVKGEPDVLDTIITTHFGPIQPRGKDTVDLALRWGPVSYTHLTLPTNREV